MTQATQSPSLGKRDTIIYERQIVAIRKCRKVLRGRKDSRGNAVLEYAPEELHIIFNDNMFLIQDAEANHPAWAEGDTIQFTLKLTKKAERSEP